MVNWFQRPGEPMSSIGMPAPRNDAEGKVRGATPYSGDLSMPGMLFMKTMFAERPHARVVSIDTRGRPVSGGRSGRLTAADVPVNEYGLQIPDQPVLCGPGSPNPEPTLSASSAIRWRPLLPPRSRPPPLPCD